MSLTPFHFVILAVVECSNRSKRRHSTEFRRFLESLDHQVLTSNITPINGSITWRISKKERGLLKSTGGCETNGYVDG